MGLAAGRFVRLPEYSGLLVGHDVGLKRKVSTLPGEIPAFQAIPHPRIQNFKTNDNEGILPVFTTAFCICLFFL
jgi:hypothetical protein